MKEKKLFLDAKKISQRINVHQPYFAFQQLWQENLSLVGSFTPEQPLLYESGPITAGELGRHLAILGSCTAVALHDGPEGYYLATKARLSRNAHKQASYQEGFHASAQVLSLDKRTLRVSAQAWNPAPIAELICEYVILSPALFRRSFQHYASECSPEPSISPYQYPIPLYSLAFQAEQLDAFAGPLSPQQCAGHFPGFPCWPVAIISQTAIQAMGELLRKKYGPNIRFHIQEAELSAEKLISAHSPLRFNIQLKLKTERAEPIDCTAKVYQQNETVAHLACQLELISPA
ncbi:hypothetical protein ACM714_27530 [Pseudomonas aeruginosa]|nr:hypothetical protein [Pseudomonas aeruginosa]HCL3292887.1 hypothetical protein [Pseudomonas aeruginosa]